MKITLEIDSISDARQMIEAKNLVSFILDFTNEFRRYRKNADYENKEDYCGEKIMEKIWDMCWSHLRELPEDVLYPSDE